MVATIFFGQNAHTEITMSILKNFGFKRGSGILLSVSSLPSKYGIGGFGTEAYKFVDFLCECKINCWQVLPLNPTSYGDSPYQSPASYAGNPYFIDPEILSKKGLLTRAELKGARHNTNRVDYGFLFNERYPLLRKAHGRFVKNGGEDSAEYRSFVKKGGKRLSDYALFMALKVHYGFRPWTEWEDVHKNVATARKFAAQHKSECGFWLWLQYEFFAEWRALADYAHERGIVIIGDMPIYVAHDSVDVWRAPEEFLLDESYNPTVVAGCPPDGFSPDGQLWGNPIYNWDKMERDGFSWWCERVKASFELYDILRIDHFRGFAGYYTIPFGDKTARGGSWNSAPGIALFTKIRDKFPRAKIIAEDLGFITDDVRELLTYTGFPGMKMLQFAFFNEDNEYLPRTYTTENCVAYPGSHDADCVRSWCLSLSGEARKRFNRECPHRRGQSRTYDLIELSLASRANLTVVPMQDYLELENSEGRMNTPSVSEGNWTYRLSARYDTERLRTKIREVNLRTGRAK